MAIETPEAYYGSESSHGSYQFVPLKEVIDGLLTEAKLDPDNYLKNTNRGLILYHAKMGIKELTKSTAKAVLKIEMTVPANSCIVMPQDYVDYVSISAVVVDGSGNRKLQLLDVNTNINTATGYLQDNNAQILFDNDENIITADASNAYNIPYHKYEFISTLGGNAMQDTAMLSAYGEFTIDENNGKIVFSSNLIDKEVVVVYESDGLQWESFGEGDIKVHKYIEQALKDWTYYACIEKRITVPANEKRRALDRYKTTKHIAKKNRAGLDLNEISRQMRTKTKHL
ncbi:MAG: hypothetical protein H7Y10_03675 [Flavobacterium sp.]|nr:hypothetical protein [Flavobacterium sp.]